jgi:hypothetical protein
MKYIGFCTPSSQTNAALIGLGDTAKYRYSISRGMVQLSSGGQARYFFSYSKAYSHSSDHSNAFLKILKKGKHLLVNQEMNLFSVAILPINC